MPRVVDENPAVISLQNVSKRFAGGLLALTDVSLQVAHGEFVALLGPSGCGKSTVLRLAAGLDEATSGEMRAPALQHDRERKGDGTTAFVFQQPTLMPWASVFDNVWLPLRLAGASRAAAAPRVRQVLAGVGLAEFERAYPAQLSGGMQMRASIARALVTQPQVLLMDEPFAALDDITRRKLNTDLLQWWHGEAHPADAGARPPISALFVTHSVTEAVFLSQRVLVMSARPGHVVAEVAVPEPYPRTQAFRLTPAFAEACRALGQALELAHGAKADNAMAASA
jgi:NitT/TauT family transport system ATP-binding protein